MHRLVLALALVACSHPAQTQPTAPAPKSSTTGDIAPQLFTVEQLRAGNPAGRVIEIRLEQDGRPTTIQRLEFTTVTADDATVHATTRDEAGNVLDDGTGKQPWTELYKHGQFPAAQTTFEDNVSVTVPAGTFKARVYTVKAGDVTKRLWFSADQPGPPLQLTIEQAGKIVLRAQMLRAR
jgi:hypothetical protein